MGRTKSVPGTVSGADGQIKPEDRQEEQGGCRFGKRALPVRHCFSVKVRKALSSSTSLPLAFRRDFRSPTDRADFASACVS